MTQSSSPLDSLPPMGRLLEIGAVVADLAAASRRLTTLFQGSASRVISEPNFRMDIQMCRAHDTDFEIMYSADPDSLIGRYLHRSGEGLHHVAFQVPDARQAMTAFRASGVPPLAQEPVRLDNLLAFFLPPKQFGGILFEFIENLHTWIDGAPMPLPDPASIPDDGIRVRGLGARVADLQATMRSFSELLGANNSEVFVDDVLGVKACISRVANIEFKLMEPIDASKVHPLLAKGHALQHVRVDALNVEAAIARAARSGVQFPAQEGCAIRCSDPRSCHGLVFEMLARDSR